MATVDKDFVIKQGLRVLGENATVDGSEIITATMLENGTHVGISAEYVVDDTTGAKYLNLTVDAGDAAVDVVAEALKLGTNVDLVADPDADPTNITVTYLPEGFEEDGTTERLDGDGNPLPAEIRLEAAPGYTDAEAKAAIAAALKSASVLRYDENSEFDIVIAADKGLEKIDGADFVLDADGNATATAQKELAVKAGNGIAVDADGVGVKLDEDGTTTFSGLEVDADGLSAKLKADSGLDVDADGISVKVEADKGISVGADGLALVAGNGIVVDADGIAVSLKEDGGLKLDGTELEVDDAIVVTLTGTQTLTNKTLGFVDPDTDEAFVTTLGAGLDAGGFNITNLAAPTAQDDAATKAYVDSVAEGLHVHESVAAATTENIDLVVGGLLTVDGVVLAEGDRVLVKNQTDSVENGIYVVVDGPWTRAADYDDPAEVDGGDFVFVTGGDSQADTGWVQVATGVATVGTDPIEFTQFSGAGTFLAGNGLTLTGSVFSIDEDVTATKTYVDTEIEDAITEAFTPAGELVSGTSTYTAAFLAPNSPTTDFSLASGMQPEFRPELSDLSIGRAVFTFTEFGGPAAPEWSDPATLTARVAVPNINPAYGFDGTQTVSIGDTDQSIVVSLETVGSDTVVTLTVDYTVVALDVSAAGGWRDVAADAVFFIENSSDFALTHAFGLVLETPAALTIDDLVTYDALETLLDSASSDTLDEVDTRIEAAIAAGDVTASPAYKELNFNDVSRQFAVEVTGIAGDIDTPPSPEVIYSWANDDYSSAEFLVKVVSTVGANVSTELTKVLVTSSGSNFYVTEYGMINTTGDQLLHSIEVALDGTLPTQANLEVVARYPDTVVTVMGTLLV